MRGRIHSDLCGFKFSLFPEQLFIKPRNNLPSPQIFVWQSHSIQIMLSIFINLRKNLVVQFSLLKFWQQKCLVAIRQLIKVLPDSLPCVNECATMPSVNSVTKSTQINYLDPDFSKLFYHFVDRIILLLFFASTQFFFQKNIQFCHFIKNIRMSDIVRNLINFAKKSGKCQEN